MIDLLQSMADGLLFGATYSLIGIGFTLVFGVMHKINMAYAAASIAGAYAGLVLLQAAPACRPWMVIPLACLAGAVFGLVIYALCFLFIPLSHPLATLMSTVGMLLLIDEIVVHSTAGMPVNYPTLVRGMVRFGDFLPARRPDGRLPRRRAGDGGAACTCCIARGWGSRRAPSPSSRWRRSCAA